MEEEVFLSGYCRAADQSRMVCIVVKEKELLEADCAYQSCPYTDRCPIAQKIQEKL